ncbi:MAG TPA: HAD-IB family hydrolase [bacterium]|nr:HAD-IB family hydrolase [bacterium]
MRPIIFDVDRTLLDGMSGYLFASWMIRERAMPLAGMYRSFRAMALYRLGLRGEIAIVEAGVTCYAGLSPRRVDELAERAVRETMSPRFYREALTQLDEHRAAGDTVLLATGSNEFLARALARIVGAHDGIGTSSLHDNGRLLPVMAQPPCMAEGKRDLVLEWLSQRGFTPTDALVYTDNGIDIPLIEAVGEAVAINPDATLAAYAAAHEIEVRHWRTPADPQYRRTGTSWPLKE